MKEWCGDLRLSAAHPLPQSYHAFGRAYGVIGMTLRKKTIDGRKLNDEAGRRPRQRDDIGGEDADHHHRRHQGAGQKLDGRRNG